MPTLPKRRSGRATTTQGEPAPLGHRRTTRLVCRLTPTLTRTKARAVQAATAVFFPTTLAGTGRPAKLRRSAGEHSEPAGSHVAAQAPIRGRAPSTALSTLRRPEEPESLTQTSKLTAPPQTCRLCLSRAGSEARKAHFRRTHPSVATPPLCSGPPYAARVGSEAPKIPNVFITHAGVSKGRVAAMPRAGKEPTARPQTGRTVRRLAVEAALCHMAAAAQPFSALPEPGVAISTEKTSAF